MTPSLILLNIIGAVCLLLWGLRSVKDSAQRAFGRDLEHIMAAATKNRAKAFGTGVILTFLMQSSTATALITASLCGAGTIPLSAGIAMIFGADVSSALLSYVFSLNIKWLAPVFLIIGLFMHNGYSHIRHLKHSGRMLVSLALMLIALQLIRQSTTPLAESDLLPEIMHILENDFIMAIILGIALTWIAHSSLAMILLYATFAASGIISLPLGIALILGANIGGTIPAVITTLQDKRPALRLTLTNLIIRSICAVSMLPFITLYADALTSLFKDNMQAEHVSYYMILTHILFNTSICIIFAPFTPLIAKIMNKIIPDAPETHDPSRPEFLNYAQIETPSIALTSATRETMRIADIVQSMLHDLSRVLKTNDLSLCYKIRERDDLVDALYKHIKFYLAKISEGELDQDESNQLQRIMSYCINLEATGDIIDKSLVDMAIRKAEEKKMFSEQGWAEIQKIHQFVMTSMTHSQTVFLNEDVDLARAMIHGKDWIRKAEKHATQAHIYDISHNKNGQNNLDIDSSSFYIDIIRDYRRINSHITTVAYPILEEFGQLSHQRLR